MGPFCAPRHHLLPPAAVCDLRRTVCAPRRRLLPHCAICASRCAVFLWDRLSPFPIVFALRRVLSTPRRCLFVPCRAVSHPAVPFLI
ncbi:hypothetical protein DENSPDRAFT_842246 [Dentipellis sp. KUC8613]|nr:hypothetical protein DENSPDRAFT_842246 [Dentipellis sp. KUC8613]